MSKVIEMGRHRFFFFPLETSGSLDWVSIYVKAKIKDNIRKLG